MSNTISTVMNQKKTEYPQETSVVPGFLSTPVSVSNISSYFLSSQESSHLPEKISSYNISLLEMDGFIVVSFASDQVTHPGETTTVAEPASTGDSAQLECCFPVDDPQRFYSFWHNNNASRDKSTDYTPLSLNVKDTLCVSIGDDSEADDQFFEETMPVNAPDSIIPPKSLPCFDTNSMIYIPEESEQLDIHTVDIIKGSELANQLGTSGKVTVDKVFYQEGTGAIYARVTINGIEQLLTLFYIKVETNLELPVTQYQLDSYLSETKDEYAPHYEFFRKELKNRFSTEVMGTKNNKIEEHKWRMKLLRKTIPKYMYPKTIAPVKYYCCNQGISGITNKKGIDVIEAVKMRMFHQEEKLVNPKGPRLKHQDKESALKHVAEQKSVLAASQRDAKKLKIHFDESPKVTLSQRQAETVKMLNEKRVMAKKARIDIGTHKDIVTFTRDARVLLKF
ncbi:hypothetical protein [Endozoicomonas sp. ONNA2]|uniref:hypothetical protein n=1 Tax=Endozoicomonas sp. ONNA2 TaxID=2828741 RepID=UPI0021477AEF|nr:hypothetical protein [Endozoicomonas sp. ONNA2]